jgi:hypothetical protein
MIDQIELLVERLRDELKQYGELMALLDRQQELVLQRDADGIQATGEQIDQQSFVLEELKAIRQRVQEDLAQAMGMSPSTTIEALLPHIPEAYCPLIKALVEDNNFSIQRIGRVARQNHMLLSRSIEMVGGLIRSICPDQTPNVYDGSGEVVSHSLYMNQTCEHVC